MPEKGTHRRPMTGPISRGVLAAGTGGAVLVLCLFGATGANAAEQAAPAVAPMPAAAAHAAQATAAAKTQRAVKTYTVVPGDYLSKIAADQKVKGGWQKLYEDNREVVGDDPSLIFPGIKLTIGAKASAADSQATPSTTAPKTAPKAAVPAKKASTTTNAAASIGASQSNRSGYTTPLTDTNVTTPYRAAGASWSSGYHTGSDFQAASGTGVRSIGPGTVVSAGWSGSYGNEVVIKHSDGMYSQYAHLSSLGVSVGEGVTGGQRIGLSGTTGNSTGPHLHFEVRTGPSYGSDVDPIAYLRSHGVSI